MRYIDFSIAKTNKQKQLILESYLLYPEDETEREKYLKYLILHAHYISKTDDYDDLLKVYDDSSEDLATKSFILGTMHNFYDSQKSKIISDIVKCNFIIANLIAQARLFRTG